MKVLQINATYANGSTGTIVKDIQQTCGEHHVDGYVAYSLSQYSQEEIKGFKIGNVLDHKLHALLCRIHGKQGYFSYFATIRLLKYIKKLRPDIIHLHNLHSNYINVNLLLKYIAKNNIVTVVTLHDCWFFTGGCFHYTNQKCNKWQLTCGSCPRKNLDFPAYLKDKSGMILQDRYHYFGGIKNLTIVGVSKWITDECQKSVFKHRNCLNIYNGVDTAIFAPTPSTLREKYHITNKYVILGPASKWLDPVNKHVLEVVSQGIGPDCVLMLFGCRQLPSAIPSNVIVTGFVSNKTELAQLYSMADVFVNCTREDSLPTINLEAQACGTPVITFDNTGAKETVDGICGFHVPTGDAESLLKMIQHVKAVDVKTQLGTEIRIRSERLYDKDVNYKKYIDLYHTLYRDRSRS